MFQSKKRPVSGCIVLMLVSCSMATIGAAETGKRTEQVGNQESILRDQVVDLKRLSSLQSGAAKQQDQTDQIALANHESVAALLPQILMMTSGSAPLPEGRRRLDDSGSLMTMPTNKRHMRLVVDNSQFGAQPSRPGTLRQRPAGGRGNQFNKIVDDGLSSQLGVNSIPHTALMAMTANENFNRMALASAKRLQRAQAEQLMGGGRGRQQKEQQQQIHRRSLRQTPMRAQARQNRPQESKVSKKRMQGKASEPMNEFDDNDERDELRSRSSDGADYDDDDESGVSDQDDERPSRANRRQSGDDIAKELDDDRSSADEGEDDDWSAPRAKSASEQRRSMGMAAARKQVSGGGRQQARAPKRANQAEEQLDVDEDIDSTNARQMTIRKRADGAARPQPRKLAELALNAPEAATDDETAIISKPRRNNNIEEQQIDGKPEDDDLSAASYVRNTAADLQTAAGKHYGGHHYYQMIEVPKKKTYKMGFKRGNKKHEIMKKEKLHKHKFHTKFAWHAKEKCKKKKKCKSVGKMTWEYKHDKKHHH